MRFAQRGGSINPQSEQQVEFFTGDTVDELAVKISDMVARYAIRIVTMSTGTAMRYNPDRAVHFAIVVFEEEHA